MVKILEITELKCPKEILTMVIGPIIVECTVENKIPLPVKMTIEFVITQPNDEKITETISDSIEGRGTKIFTFSPIVGGMIGTYTTEVVLFWTPLIFTVEQDRKICTSEGVGLVPVPPPPPPPPPPPGIKPRGKDDFLPPAPEPALIGER